MFKYKIGRIEITCDNINELRDFVDNIYEQVDPNGELPKAIADTFYAIEVDYQNWHGLESDNFDKVH